MPYPRVFFLLSFLLGIFLSLFSFVVYSTFFFFFWLTDIFPLEIATVLLKTRGKNSAHSSGFSLSILISRIEVWLLRLVLGVVEKWESTFKMSPSNLLHLLYMQANIVREI